MKVKELMEQLKVLDPEAELTIHMTPQYTIRPVPAQEEE